MYYARGNVQLSLKVAPWFLYIHTSGIILCLRCSVCILEVEKSAGSDVGTVITELYEDKELRSKSNCKVAPV